jgi:hypothetical protein
MAQVGGDEVSTRDRSTRLIIGVAKVVVTVWLVTATLVWFVRTR